MLIKSTKIENKKMNIIYVQITTEDYTKAILRNDKITNLKLFCSTVYHNTMPPSEPPVTKSPLR